MNKTSDFSIGIGFYGFMGSIILGLMILIAGLLTGTVIETSKYLIACMIIGFTLFMIGAVISCITFEGVEKNGKENGS